MDEEIRMYVDHEIDYLMRFMDFGIIDGLHKQTYDRVFYNYRYRVLGVLSCLHTLHKISDTELTQIESWVNGLKIDGGKVI
jgi:hypothetical protein